MKKYQLHWGILGTANIARKALIPAIKKARNNELTAVASRSITKAQEFSKLTGIPKAYGSYEELIKDPEINAVYIPLPNSLHKDWAIAAMRAGKHVLCEKPITLNEQEAQEMAAVAEETGLVLMEGFMYRYQPRMTKLFKLIEEDVIGSLRFIHSAFTFNLTSPNDIRLVPDLGGGALMDVGCYCIDISRQLTGREPIAVQAQHIQGNTGIDLQAAVTMDFGDNIYAQFQTAFNTYPHQICHIAGTKGSLQIVEPFRTSRGFSVAILTTNTGVRKMWFWPTNAYKQMVLHFNRLVSGKEKPRFPLSHAIANMKVIDAIFASMHAQGSVIHLEKQIAVLPKPEPLQLEPESLIEPEVQTSTDLISEQKEKAEEALDEIKVPGKEEFEQVFEGSTLVAADNSDFIETIFKENEQKELPDGSETET